MFLKSNQMSGNGFNNTYQVKKNHFLPILSTLSLTGPRKMFLVAFTNILSRFLQQNGIKCYPHCVYNYFSVAKNRNSKDLWRGKYSCTNPECDVFYVAYIKSI